MNRYKLSKAGIGANEGIKRFNGNVDKYEYFLMSFPEDQNYSKLKEYIAAGDVENSFQAAHALKGLCGNLSINSLSEIIVPLVEELRDDHLERAIPYMAPLEEQYQSVVSVLLEMKDKE